MLPLLHWLLVLVAIALIIDALRLRDRLGALQVLPERSHEAAQEAGAWIVAEGADVPPEAREAAAAYADAHGLDVLDLVPRDCAVERAMEFARAVDTRRYRANRLARGCTAGVAMYVSPQVCARANVRSRIADPVEMIELAARLKQYASNSADCVAAAQAHAPADERARRLETMRARRAGATPFLLGAELALLAGLGVGLAVPGTRMAALLAIACFHAQPLLALSNGPIRSHDLGATLLFRYPAALWTWIVTVTSRRGPETAPDGVERRRSPYAELLARGVEGFFEPRRQSCPGCGSEKLIVRLRTGDLLQHKPGVFTLERCLECGEIFQNPRLTPEGLDFYYKDFYDGLGERTMEFIFGFSAASYAGRARMLTGRLEPSTWLDVGAGHGHFGLVARDVWPRTRFDGLDLSESIEEAARRRWIDRAYRGLLPDLAPSIGRQYDVVSMCHYLEHTREPAAEIRAVRSVLNPGGYVLIEVPDPQSRLGDMLGRYWVPWFQPQHLHLLPASRLGELLSAHGFEPIAWQRAEAHQSVDLLFAVIFLLGRLAPPPDLPWRPRPSLLPRVRRAVVWSVGTPFLIIAHLGDVVLAPLIRWAGASNTYRVLAQLRDEPASPANE